MPNNPQTPAELRAEAERVEKLLEGVTPGEWQSGHESVWALGEQGTNRMYILIQPGFDGQHRTSSYELDANARIIAQSKRLATAHADLLRRHAEVLAIAEAARKLYANRLGWSEGRNPYAPRELWDELGRALGADPAGFCDPPDVCRSCDTPVARRSEMYTTEDGDLVCADCAEFDEDDAQAPASAEGGEG